MFLYQSKGYTTKFIKTPEELTHAFKQDKPKYICYDTETTGLNIMLDLPFLYTVGWGKKVFAFEPTKEMIEALFDIGFSTSYVFAHNAKFDWHMTYNFQGYVSELPRYADTTTVLRLVEYADKQDGISLEKVGTKYIDDNAKFAGKVIKTKLNEINRERLSIIKADLKTKKPPIAVGKLWEKYMKRVQYVESDYDEWFKYIDENYSYPTYKDVYELYPDLMISYAYDDIVIMLEFLNSAFEVLEEVDENLKVFHQECKLIPVIAKMEREGLKTDIDYLLKSRITTIEYMERTYNKLWELMGVKLTINQNDRIMELFKQRYDIEMANCDKQTLKNIISLNNEASEIAKIITNLRTVKKWLSTYIEGMLNRLIGDRVYTNVNNSGAVTGRVASNFQQQPKEAMYGLDGVELFYPRKATINDEGGRTFYFDYSQMELRVQAQYTIDISDGDIDLCRAFIPLNLTSMFTGEMFDTRKSVWDSGEWINEDGNFWTPTDLHTLTTLKAFPHLDTKSSSFEHYRRLGKMVNFLKNYGGGRQALKDKLDIDDDFIDALNNGYYEAFPKIRDYQNWVDGMLHKYGYAENYFGS